MIQEVTMYTVICDRCGEDAGASSDHCAWNDPDAAVDMALDTDEWHKIDGKHYCHNCVQWNEDESELIPKPVDAPAQGIEVESPERVPERGLGTDSPVAEERSDASKNTDTK